MFLWHLASLISAVSDILRMIKSWLCSRPPWILIVLLIRDCPEFIAASFYYKVIERSVDVQIQIIEYVVYEGQTLIQMRERYLPSGVSQFY